MLVYINKIDLKGMYHAHFQVLYLYSGALLVYLFMIYSSKTLYLSYTGALCSSSVQPLSETGRFGSCLLKACLPMSPLCSDWPASSVSADFWRFGRLHKQTVAAGFHFFFLYFTQNGNFWNTSLHIWGGIWSKICDWTMWTTRGTTLATTARRK